MCNCYSIGLDVIARRGGLFICCPSTLSTVTLQQTDCLQGGGMMGAWGGNLCLTCRYDLRQTILVPHSSARCIRARGNLIWPVLLRPISLLNILQEWLGVTLWKWLLHGSQTWQYRSQLIIDMIDFPFEVCGNKLKNNCGFSSSWRSDTVRPRAADGR